MDDQLEFLISQYADGTLDAGAAGALEARIADDPAAQAALAEHRRLTALLRNVPMPAVQWGRLAKQINTAVAAAPEAPASYRLFAWRSKPAWAAIGLAASVLIAAVVVRMEAGGHQTIPAPAGPAIVASIADVTGPHADLANGPASVEVSIGPGKGFAAGGSPAIYADLVSRPSRVLVASGAAAVDDTPQLPF